MSTFAVTVTLPADFGQIVTELYAAWQTGIDPAFPEAPQEPALLVRQTDDPAEVWHVDGPALIGDQLLAVYPDTIDPELVDAVKAPLLRRAAVP